LCESGGELRFVEAVGSVTLREDAHVGQEGVARPVGAAETTPKDRLELGQKTLREAFAGERAGLPARSEAAIRQR